MRNKKRKDYIKNISIILMSLFLIINLSAKDYLFEAYGVSELSTIEISDNFKFSAYTSEGMWDDNNGDYGNEKCSGYLKQKNKKVELEIFCETVNQNNEKFWNSRIRKSDIGGGIGKMTIINGTGKYKNFIGYECPYGVNYKKQYAWFRAECKIKN